MRVDARPAADGTSHGELDGPRLSTPRLELRPFARVDLDDLYSMDRDARVMRWLGKGLAPRTRNETADALQRIEDFAAQRPGLSLLHARLRDGGGFVGACGLFPLPDDDSAIEIAYRLPHIAWGRGYATEMARAVLAHGLYGLALPRVVGLTHADNVASQRVLLKIGMRAIGEAVHYERVMRVFVADRATAEARV